MAGDINIGSLFDGLFKLGGEFIEDKDKRNEFNMMIARSQNDFNTAIINMKTTPKVDALVKLLYALNALWRPIGSAAMFVFGVYAVVTGIEISTELSAILFGAFPAWGAFRQLDKAKK